MKSKSIKNWSNQYQLPKLLGKREKTPLKSYEKSIPNNWINIRNSADVPDFNKYVLTTECIVENTIESTNNGDLKKILKASTELPSKMYDSLLFNSIVL